MANEGTNQTGFFSGWSYVVHQPCEDNEDADLPSTVDITAFSGGLNVEPTSNAHSNTQNNESDSETDVETSNSGSEASQSCSQSDSSDSDSSTSTLGESSSRSQSPVSKLQKPEFSVRNQNGLRVTIATVKKPCPSPTVTAVEKRTSNHSVSKNVSSSSESANSSDSDDNDSVVSRKSSRSEGKLKRNVGKAVKKVSKVAGPSKYTNKREEKHITRKEERKNAKKDGTTSKTASRSRPKSKRMASQQNSSGNDGSTSESEDSDADSAMLASCSLQEIRQEDLAAILPDQNECDAFGSFESADNHKSPQEGDISGSDMELPQQAVNDLINRTTESSSDSEGHAPPNPSTLFANSFLQQFEAQTQQIVSTTSCAPSAGSELTNSSVNNGSKLSKDGSTLSESERSKKKRGRPKKTSKEQSKAPKHAAYSASPNVSPDSGIQNSPDHISSPEPQITHKNKSKDVKTTSKKVETKKPNEKPSSPSKEITNKLSVTLNRFDRLLYSNTERVLYPPRRNVGRTAQKKGPGRPSKSKPPEVKPPEKPKVEDKPKPSTKKSRRTPVPLEPEKTEISNKEKECVQKKSKSSLLYEIVERVSKRLELGTKNTKPTTTNSKTETKDKSQTHPKTKQKSRPVLTTKNKLDSRPKFATLKNSKVMHSKHKHQKHKKCKFKILKPLSSSGVKTCLDIEKLIADFMKLCISNNVKPTKENMPEILKTLKKVSKKRKTTESERKKKKQSTNPTVNKETNSNEQRLPLKKRHYHMSTSEIKGEVEPPAKEEDSESKVKALHKQTSSKTEKPKPSNVTKPDVKQSPKHVSVQKSNASPKQNINNNEYEPNQPQKSVTSHIDEAIEACINRFTEEPKTSPQVSPVVKESNEEKNVQKTITATTPKKRHRPALTENNDESKSNVISPVIEQVSPVKTSLESVVSELKMKRNLTPKINECSKKQDQKEKKEEIITKKKNRLEDLTSNLVSKINPVVVEIEKKKREPKEEPKGLNRYPTCRKAKPTDLEKLNEITSPHPTGIFMPTVDLVDNDLKPIADLLNKVTKAPKSEPKTPAPLQQPAKTSPTVPQTPTPIITPEKKKVRKRRAINRTGFPSVKRKKKKVVPVVEVEVLSVVTDIVEVTESPIVCDRVPKEGEECKEFVERTEVEKIEALPEIKSAGSDEFLNANKWEVMSECSSLPQDERTDFDFDEDIKHRRDLSPATSVDTRFSETSKSKDDDLDDYPLDARIEKLKSGRKRKRCSERLKESGAVSKKRLRDISPASSVEPLTEQRLREDRGSASGDEFKKNKKMPRWRKKYLVAGLFSDYYKMDEEMMQKKTQEAANLKTKLIYNPEEHPYGLLPPPSHCGRFLRCRKKPFRLPFDIWWLHTHGQLPGKDLVPSWNYRRIRTNVYNVKSNGGACEPQTCNCTTEQGCGDDCINRMVFLECPASHRCKNQKIQKHEYAPGIDKFMTEDKGWGVRTKLPIKNGEFILEYVGEVVSDQVFKERMASIYVNDTHHYCLHLDGGLVIDGHRMGGECRFVNHSCKPNCEMQKWSVNGQFRMALFALRDIEEGEELTYDYNFSLFNPAEGQECKCGTDICRGVIGGKSQRVNKVPVDNKPVGRVGRPRKNQAKKASSKDVPVSQSVSTVIPAQIKPFSYQQKCFILEHHCFLLRNIHKARKVRSKPLDALQNCPQRTATPTIDHSAAFINHFNALDKPRNVRTRRIAQAEDDPDFNKTVKLAAVLKEVFGVVIAAKDEKDELLSTPFMTLPPKRKLPDFYQKILDPIDFSTIEHNITTGIYRTIETFDEDMNRVFASFIKFYGRTNDIGLVATRLKKIYTDAKQQNVFKFEDVLGTKPPPTFAPKRRKTEDEDIIRCICGIFCDEGLMIQCEKCFVWQHNECVKADVSAASYHCEKCVPREVDYEIPMDEFTEHGHRYYMTLMRGDLQLRQGDTVYVLRDMPIPGTKEKHTYKTIKEIKYSDMDIFRIERLWKDKDTGKRLAYGHHYLRPHETYHEPTRKFFPNEVMRVPLYEAVPVELIIRHCWVMDLNTFCKGRPIDADEEHIYICELRVDKSARLFSKVSKSKYPTCTKSYVFDRFDQRLKVSRTYTPHEVDPSLIKPKNKKTQDHEEVKEVTQVAAVRVPVIKTRTERKDRLNKILLNLLRKMPRKEVCDLSYLLDGGRRRKNKQ